jgi:hypothetical protein
MASDRMPSDEFGELRQVEAMSRQENKVVIKALAFLFP